MACLGGERLMFLVNTGQQGEMCSVFLPCLFALPGQILLAKHRHVCNQTKNQPPYKNAPNHISTSLLKVRRSPRRFTATGEFTKASS